MIVEFNLRQTPCSDCPFRKEGHINIDNIAELADFLEEDEGHVSYCHQDGYASSNTICKGAELYKHKDNIKVNVFINKDELIKSHKVTRLDHKKAVLERF